MYKFAHLIFISSLSLSFILIGCGEPNVRHLTHLDGVEDPGPNGEPDPNNPEVNPPVTTNPPTNVPPVVPPATTPTTPTESACSCKATQGAKVHHISSSGRSLSLTLTKASIIEVTGSHNEVIIDIPSSGNELSLLCILVRGNSNKIKLKDGTTVKTFYYDGSGNSSSTSIEILTGKTFQSLGGKLSGHMASLTIKGIDPNKCRSIQLKNSTASLSCSL